MGGVWAALLFCWCAVFLSFWCVRLIAEFEPGLGRCLAGWEGGVCPFLVSWLCLLAPIARAALLFPLRSLLPVLPCPFLSASQVAFLPRPWA